MFTHSIIHKALLTAFVLSMTSLASAHNFPRPPTKTEIAAGRAVCAKAMTTGASNKRSFARFAPEIVVTTGTYRVAGAHRFGGGSHVPVVACTQPMRSHVACL
jgi:hypothetical protein